MSILCTKFGNFQTKVSKDGERTSLVSIDGPTEQFFKIVKKNNALWKAYERKTDVITYLKGVIIRTETALFCF